MKTKEKDRLEYERSTIEYWLRLFERHPATAFQSLATKLLDLEWELINLQRRIDRGND